MKDVSDPGLRDWKKFIEPTNQDIIRTRLMSIYRDRLIGFQELANDIGINVITLGRFLREGRVVKWKTLHKILDWIDWQENKRFGVN